MSPRQLARFVDDLATRSGVSLSEGVGADIRIDGLSIDDSVELLSHISALNWSASVEDEAGYPVPVGSLSSGIEPYSVSFKKPPVAPGELAFLSVKTFTKWMLDFPRAVGIVRVAGSIAPFRTLGFVVCPWDAAETNEVAPPLRSPRDIVRSIGSVSPLPADIRPFLLAGLDDIPWRDVVFNAWLYAAVPTLAYSIASEVENAFLTFVGPPRLTLSLDATWDPADLSEAGFISLQQAVLWIYELEREAQLRHHLFAHEFARVARNCQSAAKAIGASCSDAWDGAKITYQYGLNEQSKDAIKSLSELRKTVAEETSRILDTSRQLALGSAGALFYELGLLAGKLVTAVSPWVFDAMAILGFAYLAAVIVANTRFLIQQNHLRRSWRKKLYRYITDVEYRDLVTTPVQSAESTATWILVVSAVLGVVALACVIMNDHTQLLDVLLRPAS